jgi:hypothetical protein
MVKFLSWNIRGIGSEDKRNGLRDLLLRCRFDVVGLQETNASLLHEPLLRNIGAGIIDRWLQKPVDEHIQGIILGWRGDRIQLLDYLIGTYHITAHFFGTSKRARTTRGVTCDSCR